MSTADTQLQNLETQVAQLTKERDGLKLAAQRSEAAQQIADALAREIDGAAAREVAAGLADQMRFGHDGTLEHPEFGRRPDVLAGRYLDGRGSFLRKTAPKKEGQPVNAGGEAFDIARAATDIAYKDEWKKKDPVAFKTAWGKHLAELSRK